VRKCVHRVIGCTFESDSLLTVVRPSVCNVGGSGSHMLEILETNHTVN